MCIHHSTQLGAQTVLTNVTGQQAARDRSLPHHFAPAFARLANDHGVANEVRQSCVAVELQREARQAAGGRRHLGGVRLCGAYSNQRQEKNQGVKGTV